MKTMIIVPTILAVIAVLGILPLTFASSSSTFNGSFSGTFTITPGTSTTITGHATGPYEHLGKTTILAKVTITGASECGGFTATEEDTFTAANGDHIFATAIDIACPTSSPNIIHITASTTISGGTGRFVHASGSFTTQVSAATASPTATTGTSSGTSTGTIAY